MKRIEKIVGPGQAVAKPLLRRAATLTLAFEERSRSRLAALLDDGTEVALFLPRGTVLRGGDVLVADDGSLVRVMAAAQPVLRATAADPHLLLRAAYHLGNRHTPVEVGASYLQLEPDPVLRDLLRRLGLTVETMQAPFEPEAGAYGGGHKHGHDATFAEDYALAQQAFHARHGDGDGGHHRCGHDHAGEHSHGGSHAEIPGHGHGHGHGHEHGHELEHGHAHRQGQAHDHAHRPEHEHDHGHESGHGHGHGHGEQHGHAHGHPHEHAHEPGHQHGSGHAHGHQHGHRHDDDRVCGHSHRAGHDCGHGHACEAGHGHAHSHGTKAGGTRDRN